VWSRKTRREVQRVHIAGRRGGRAELKDAGCNVRPVEPDGLERVQTKMTAGDLLFLHGSVVHGSKPNSTADRFRRALIFHYIPEDSAEIAAFCNPLIRSDRRETVLPEAIGGGPCGDYAEMEP
jgi:phytanoyl-CoA hydroxylase